MKVSTEQKLFIVEFGKPDEPGWSSFGSSNHDPVFVIAKSFDEVVSKSLEYADSKTKSITDSDGNLKSDDGKVKIKSIKVACEQFVY